MTEKYSRIIRFVDLTQMPQGYAAVYDADRNIVTIDKELFDRLNTFEQNQLLFTEADIKYLPQ